MSLQTRVCSHWFQRKWLRAVNMPTGRSAKFPDYLSTEYLPSWAPPGNNAPQSRSWETASPLGVFRSITNSSDYETSVYFLKLTTKIIVIANRSGISDSESEHVGKQRRTCLSYYISFASLAKRVEKYPWLTILANGCAQHLGKRTNLQRLFKAKTVE